MIPSNKDKLLSSSSANFIPWRRFMETKIAQDGLSKHLKFPTCKSYIASSDYLKDDLEQQYDADLQVHLEDIAIALAAADINEDKARRARIQATEKVDLDYKQAATWRRERTKLERQWRTDEETLLGLIRSTMDVQYWTNLKDCHTAYQVWQQLKKETQRDQPGTLMALLIKFFNSRIQDGELLTSFTARVQDIADEIAELGYDFITPTMVCFSILSTMPDKYETIQQQIFQLPTSQINLATIKSRFAQEDARRMKPLNNNNNNYDNPPFEEAHNATDSPPTIRHCSKCRIALNPTTPAYFSRCTPCQVKWKKPSQEKVNAAVTKKKKATKVLSNQVSTKDKKKSKAMKQQASSSSSSSVDSSEDTS